MRRLTPLFVLIALLVTTSLVTTVAQEATPATSDVNPAFPLVADPALCTVEPRDPQTLLDIWFPSDGTPMAPTPAPTAVTIPLGEPFDDPTVLAGITTTVHEFYACAAAGDYLRIYALFTDEGNRAFGPGPDVTRETAAVFLENLAALEATPMAEPVGEPGRILAITDVALLEDGRVGAFVVDDVRTVRMTFEQSGDRWLIAEMIEFS